MERKKLKLYFTVRKISFFSATILFLTGCGMSHRISKIKEAYTVVPETNKSIDIPLYESPHPFEGMEFNYWHYAKQKEKQLNLPNLETSSIVQVFRIWITNQKSSRGQAHGLINIECQLNSCNGELILMRVNFKAKTLSETITSIKKMELQSNILSWREITDSLIQLKFHLLPTDEEIPDYYDRIGGYMNNEPTFSFEYSTPNEYRFYPYNDVTRVADKFWQAANVIKIFELLEEEFQWDEKAEKYFLSNR